MHGRQRRDLAGTWPLVTQRQEVNVAARGIKAAVAQAPRQVEPDERVPKHTRNAALQCTNHREHLGEICERRNVEYLTHARILSCTLCCGTLYTSSFLWVKV